MMTSVKTTGVTPSEFNKAVWPSFRDMVVIPGIELELENGRGAPALVARLAELRDEQKEQTGC